MIKGYIKVQSKDGTRQMVVEKSLLPQYRLQGWVAVKEDSKDSTSANLGSFYGTQATIK